MQEHNTALAIASLGVNLGKQLANAKKGVYTFRIQGTMYHSLVSSFQKRERHLHLLRYTSMIVQLKWNRSMVNCICQKLVYLSSDVSRP